MSVITANAVQSAKCLHCGRPIRVDSSAYAADGGFYHYECTEPVVGVTISRIELAPDDVVVAHVEKPLHSEQVRMLKQAISAGIPGHQVLVLHGGVELSVLSRQQIR